MTDVGETWVGTPGQSLLAARRNSIDQFDRAGRFVELEQERDAAPRHGQTSGCRGSGVWLPPSLPDGRIADHESEAVSAQPISQGHRGRE
jgi:hypothetical protein